jgi:protein TonB
MPRDLFNGGTASTSAARGVRRYATVGVALLLHLGIVAVVLIVPLFADDVLPTPDIGRVRYVDATFVAPPPPSAPPVVRRVQADVPNPDAAPVVAPHEIRPEQPAPEARGAEYVPNSIPGDGSSSVTGVGITIGDGPAPPPTSAPPAPRGPVKVGGAIREPVKIVNVNPIYPQIAQAARVEGIVKIQAIIGTDGVVQEASVVSGAPLLNEAALTAVRQWRYRPTLLNNQPVAVIMTVTINFTLQH